MELMAASRQWATRPADERFTSLTDLHKKTVDLRERSNSSVISSRKINVMPHPADPTYGVMVDLGREQGVLSHWSFGQLANLGGAPAGYLRQIPAPLASDCLNYGLRFKRDAEDVKIFTHDFRDAEATSATAAIDNYSVAAATGPNYGRIYNSEIVGKMVDMFGNGVDGDWRVPGIWGKALDAVTKENTTIFGSDRNIFVFLADEKNKLQVSNRRNGEAGGMSRGFFVWNSEVGDGSFGVAYFLFDEVCQNRIVWGAREYKEVRIRHTAKAPDRYLEEVAPVLEAYRSSESGSIEQTIKAAQEAKIKDDLDDFLKRRFTQKEMVLIKDAHDAEENRPMETLWDVTTGVTAYAKSIRNNDDRVAVERKGGAILDLVAV